MSSIYDKPIWQEIVNTKTKKVGAQYKYFVQGYGWVSQHKFNLIVEKVKADYAEVYNEK